MTAIPHWRVAGTVDARSGEVKQSWSSVWWDGEGLHISANETLEHSFYRLSFKLGASFDVVPAKQLIVPSAQKDDVEQNTIDLLLSDQVEPRVLAHEGKLIIHASAIELDGMSILFVGTSGVGKSTLAASFDLSGNRMLCDDAVIVEFGDGRPTARALYPSLRLHPDSLDALFPDLNPSSAVAHHGLKRRLKMPGPPVGSDDPLPIAAIFALGTARTTDDIRIRPLSSAEVCMALVSNSFSLNPADLRLAGEKLRKSGLVAECVPGFSLDYPREYAGLPAARAAVVKAVRALVRKD